MGTNDLKIQICESVDEAPDYVNDHPEINGATIEKVIVVRNGTKGGNDTVDIHFVSQYGKTYVAMITAALLKTLTDICITDRAET